tara:strand:+ start:645 stop:767 length:123 start_codon:yes stop_codon:yes gene_type:complete
MNIETEGHDMRRMVQDISAATAILGFAWMITMWGSVLGSV